MTEARVLDSASYDCAVLRAATLSRPPSSLYFTESYRLDHHFVSDGVWSADQAATEAIAAATRGGRVIVASASVREVQS